MAASRPRAKRAHVSRGCPWCGCLKLSFDPIWRVAAKKSKWAVACPCGGHGPWADTPEAAELAWDSRMVQTSFDDLVTDRGGWLD